MKKFFFSIFLLFVCQYSMAQSNVLKKEISLQVQDAKLGDVLKKIETLASVNFAYESGVINRNRRITLAITKMQLQHVLKILLYEDGAKYTVVANQIILFQPNYQSNPLASIPVRDTIWTNKLVIDTNRVHIYDTIQVYDTIIIKRNQKPIKKPKPTPNFIELE